ncbi:MAG: hypothetical protein ACRD21_04360 [Vicinamibacteria bacterium]
MRRIAVVALVAGLVAVGCLRPALSALSRESWTAAVILLAGLASVAVNWCARSEPPRRSYEAVLWALFPLTLAVLYLQPQRVASDGIFYYAPLRSLAIDFDLDFENEYRVLGAEPGYFHPTTTGRLPNNYSIGPAFLWAPWFLAAHALGLIGLYRPTGFGYPYFTAIATATAFGGFLGVLFVFRLLRDYFDSGPALLATLLTWFATFHIWYMVFEPSMSHAFAMASVSGFLLFTHRGIGGPRSFFLAGAAGGLVALIRWQNVIFLPIAAVTSVSKHGWPKPKEILLGAAGFLFVFAPQLLYWKLLYGSFLLVPQGGGYLDLGSPHLEEVLLSSRHGLLSWAPVLWLALAGIPTFVRRAPAFGISLVAAFFLALYVNASVFDWWAGASFGSRRFDGALAGLGLGLAAAIEWLVRRVERHPVAVMSTLLAPFAIWNFLLMGVYFGGAVPPDGPASFRQAAADGVELLYRRTGYPFSWPGSVPHLLVEGRPLASYDLAGSGVLSNNVDIRMGETDALHLGRGWSLPRRAREGTYREAATSGAGIYVSLAEPAPYRLTLVGKPFEKPSLLWNGVDLGSLTLDAEGRGSVSVPASGVVSGINEIVVSSSGEGPLPVFRITLTRPGDFD